MSAYQVTPAIFVNDRGEHLDVFALVHGAITVDGPSIRTWLFDTLDDALAARTLFAMFGHPLPGRYGSN